MEFLSGTGDQKRKHPILFLHGAYCGGWVWREHFLKFFSNRGFDCYSINFEAEDSMFPLESTNLKTYAKQVIRAVDDIGEKPIIVAHSMGAAVMQRLYQTEKVEFPGWVLMTPAPPRGFYEASQEMLLQHPALFSQIYMLQMLGTSFVSPGLIKFALFSDDFNEEKALSYMSKVKSLPNSVAFDVMTMNIPNEELDVNFPVLIQAATQDKLLSSKNIEMLEETFKTKAKYYESGHAIMLDVHWRKAAEDIIKFIESVN